jgi:NitT/TauT family transport system substrate-binding protein
MKLSMTMKRVLFIFLISLLVIPSGVQAATKVTVGVSSVNVAFLPLFVSKEKGFFEQEGLEVRLATFKSGTENAQAVLSGDAQIGAGAPVEVVIGVDAGAATKVFWGQSNIMPYQFYSDPDIKSMKEIQGKRFAVSKYGSLSDFLTRYAIRKYGFNPEKDTKILQVGSTPARYAALKSKAVDVALLWAPVTNVAAQDGYRLLLDFKEVFPEWTYEVFYAKEDYLRKDAETVKKFLNAYRKGIDFLKKNPEESVKILIKYVGFKEKDAKDGYQEYKDAFPMDGRIELKSIEIMIEQSYEAGEISKKYALKEIIDDTFIKQYSK